MRIPEEVIENIRQEANILDVVSQYVQMKKRGKNHFGFCPFHEEKTASFSIQEEKQLFHCFSCGRGGNVFSFIMEIEGLTFPESVIKTAELMDIELDPTLARSVDQFKPAEHSETGQLLSLHEHVQEFYHHILMHTKTGEPALAYLEERGLHKETIEHFKIGFAPDQRHLLQAFASEKKGWDEAVLEKSGLFIKRDDGSLQDRFYNRIMFPLANHQGKTVAFSGRIFKENPDYPAAKYLNSPETDLFNKRMLLFHFEAARPSIRKEKETYLFEGFMDVIAAYQAGLSNAVATMGTSLTSEHIQQLEKITDHVILSFDGDAAGNEATKRAAEFLTKETPFSLEIIPFPEGLDPDDLIQEKGPAYFLDFMKNSRLTLIGFLMRYHKKGKNLHNDSQRIDYINTILTEMTRVPSAVEREVYFNQLSQEFELPIDTLREQFQTAYLTYKKEAVYERKEQSKHLARTAAFTQVKKQPRLETKVTNAEKQLLNRLFHFEEARLHLAHTYPEFHFYTEEFNLLYVLMDEFYSQHTPNMGAFIDYLKESAAKQLAVEIEWLSFGDHVTTEELDDCIRIIQQEQWVEKLAETRKQLEDAQKSNDLLAQQKLVMEIISLNRKIKEVRLEDPLQT